MNFSRFTTLAALIGAASLISLQAAVKDLPTKKVNGKLYHYYEVPAKETVYSLCHKLDITKDEIIRHNPAVADGLRKGMVLFFPAQEPQPAATTATAPDSDNATSKQVISHYVNKGETIFGIAHKYGLKTEDVIAQNPVLKNGLKAGQTITLTVPGSKAPACADSNTSTAKPPVKKEAEPSTAAPRQEMRGYVVKKKETFYSIAIENGLTVAALEAANPGIITLKEGQVLNIPYVPKEAVNADEHDELTASNEHADHTAATETDQSTPLTPLTPAAPVETKEPVSIAVILPFMLNEETPSKSAMRYTEFYKGFLIAVDSLRSNGAPIHVTAYDTEGSVLKVREALTDTAFRKHNAIIAPDNASQLAILAEYGKNNNVKVFNTFLVRDKSYITNPTVMHGNLPSALMYRKATDALMERLSYSTPVFVSFKGENGDKAEFVSALKQSLTDKGNTFMNIEVDGRLESADLRALPTDGNYTFIPTSSRQADLNRIMPGIIEWRDEAVTPMVRLFGYPEWTTFRGETLDNMHNLNTTVYSRFYTHEDAPRTHDIDAKYKKWYGNRMENAVPRQGLLGFDTGMFVIPYLLHEASSYDGVQNGYFFTTAGDGAGSYNDALYFINFRPGNIIEKSRI